MLLQIFLNSLINGLVIGTLALSFMLVYRPTKVFYLALGGIYALAPYIVLELVQRGANKFLAVGAAVIICTIVSLGCEFFSHSRLFSKNSEMAHLISSLGIYIIIVQIIAIIWGPDNKSFNTEIAQTYNFIGLKLTQPQIIEAGTLLCLLGTFGIWLKKSQLGLVFRGLANNPDEMQMLGHPIPWLRLLAFGLSGFLTSITSILIANDSGFDPYGGISAVLLGVIGVIIGGRDNFIGPVIGGIILSLVRSTATWYYPKWQEGITYLLLAVFLLFIPNGVFNRPTRVETE